MIQLTNQCPYCHEHLQVTRMTCNRCQVSIDGDFPDSRLSNLPTEHQRFIEMFVLASGSLKEIAKQTGVSYPTVRSRLDKVIEALRGEISKTGPTRGSILDVVAKPESPSPKPAKVKQRRSDASLAEDADSASRLIKRI